MVYLRIRRVPFVPRPRKRLVLAVRRTPHQIPVNIRRSVLPKTKEQ